jgi:hypothetical protein
MADGGVAETLLSFMNWHHARWHYTTMQTASCIQADFIASKNTQYSLKSKAFMFDN